MKVDTAVLAAVMEQAPESPEGLAGSAAGRAGWHVVFVPLLLFSELLVRPVVRHGRGLQFGVVGGAEAPPPWSVSSTRFR